jgi:hypothetical protein
MSEQQPAFQYSVKIDTTAKGTAVVTIHCYGNDIDKIRQEAVAQYEQTVKELRAKNFVTPSEGGKAQ